MDQVELAAITAFRQLIDTHVDEFVNTSRFFGEPLTAMSQMVKRAFEFELNFIITGLNCARPDDATFNNFIEPLSDVIREIQEFRDRNRHVEQFFNHLSTVSESIVALSWISVRTAPAQFVRDMRDAGEYFGNRVLSTNRGNLQHMIWITNWNDILKALEQYVLEYHRTGFDWAGGVPPALSAPPPPPPPPRPTVADIRAAGDGQRAALINQINQGVDIVRMLRPVRRDADAPPRQAVAVETASQPPPVPRTHPPKFYLDGRKWRVEHVKNNFTLHIETANMSESVAMFKCEKVGLELRNKMNGVTIDNCKLSTVIVKDIISSVELIRCDRVKLQCSGHVPLISLDNCDSVQVFLTEDSIDAEIISSKSTSLNVCLLAPDGDYTELAVPEQIRCVVVDRRLQSTAVEKI